MKEVGKELENCLKAVSESFGSSLQEELSAIDSAISLAFTLANNSLVVDLLSRKLLCRARYGSREEILGTITSLVIVEADESTKPYAHIARRMFEKFGAIDEVKLLSRLSTLSLEFYQDKVLLAKELISGLIFDLLISVESKCEPQILVDKFQQILRHQFFMPTIDNTFIELIPKIPLVVWEDAQAQLSLQFITSYLEKNDPEKLLALEHSLNQQG